MENRIAASNKFLQFFHIDLQMLWKNTANLRKIDDEFFNQKRTNQCCLSLDSSLSHIFELEREFWSILIKFGSDIKCMKNKSHLLQINGWIKITYILNWFRVHRHNSTWPNRSVNDNFPDASWSINFVEKIRVVWRLLEHWCYFCRSHNNNEKTVASTSWFSAQFALFSLEFIEVTKYSILGRVALYFVNPTTPPW